MKHIIKKSTPDFFITDTSGLITWNSYNSNRKRYLKEFILENEQNWLCCYCEKKITADKTSSHIEHVKPKSLDVLALTFDYNNLLVSCEGNHFNEIGDNTKSSCGHKKDNLFDEEKFLNPIEVSNICDYFTFDSDTGMISASSKDSIKANYTLEVLNLNGENNRLAEARKKAKEALVRNFIKLPNELKKVKFKEFLANDSNEFITFFRYVYRFFK